MLYHWPVPRDIDRDSDLRLKLMTDEPATTHISGTLRITTNATSSLSIGTLSNPTLHEFLTGHMMSVLSAGLLLILLISCFILRLRRSAARIVLE